MDSQLLKLGNSQTLAFMHIVRQVLSLSTKNTFLLANNIALKSTIKDLIFILLFLQKHSLCSYKQLIEISVEDTPKYQNRFRTNYILSSVLYAHKILVSTTTNELLYLPSVTNIFPSAG